MSREFTNAKRIYDEVEDLIKSNTCGCEDCNMLKKLLDTFETSVEVANQERNPLVLAVIAFTIGCIYEEEEGRGLRAVLSALDDILGVDIHG